jgi:cephalosporin hydroxylase
MGAIAHILHHSQAKAVVEIGVEHGGLSVYFLSYSRYSLREMAYLGVDISLGSLDTQVASLEGSNFIELDAWHPATVSYVHTWIQNRPGPALIFCDGGDKPRELRLYAPLLRPGDVLLGHDYNNEYVDDALTAMPPTVRRVQASFLDDTLLCMFIVQ